LKRRDELAETLEERREFRIYQLLDFSGFKRARVSNYQGTGMLTLLSEKITGRANPCLKSFELATSSVAFAKIPILHASDDAFTGQAV